MVCELDARVAVERRARGHPAGQFAADRGGGTRARRMERLEARRGREAIHRAIVVGRDAPRRVVTGPVPGLGWRFRGGASADAYAALGAASRLAPLSARTAAALCPIRASSGGQAIRWRRGSSADSLVRLMLQPRRGGGPARADTLVLRFAAGSALQETPPLPPGIYDVIVPGGRTTLVVNASAELLPSRPQLRSGEVGRRASADDARGARNVGVFYGSSSCAVRRVILRRRGVCGERRPLLPHRFRP